MMNGAESLVRTLVGGGVDVCFANPGTSEMHFVAALDRVEGMRGVLGLFEGVVTGAADGYARMGGNPPPPCCISGRAWPTASPTCTTPARRLADGQHRRRPCDLSPQIRCAAGLGHRSGWRGRPRTGSRLRPDAVGRRRRGRGDRRGATAARPDRHPDPAGRRRLERGFGPAPTVRPRTARGRAGGGRRGGAGVERGKPCLLLGHRPGAAQAGLERPAASPPRPARGCRPGSHARTTRRAAGCRSSASLFRRAVVKVLAGVEQSCWSARVPVAFFAYPDKPSLLAPEGGERHCWPAAGDGSARWRRWPMRSARREPAPWSTSGPAARERHAHSGGARPLDRRALAGGRDRRRRVVTAGRGISRRPAGPAARLAARTWAARSAWACRWRPARRSPAPAARSSRSKATAGRCTPAVAVDPGAREARRHHRFFANRSYRSSRASWPGSGPSTPAERRWPCSISAIRISISSTWRKAWACRRAGRDDGGVQPAARRGHRRTRPLSDRGQGCERMLD